MIVKEREIPLKILKLQALLRRLPEPHPKIPIIKQDLAKHLSGYNGEKSIDYYLSFLSNEDYHIFHDIRLFDGERFFQIDTLILTSHYALILEIKNMVGTLNFDGVFNQLVQTKNGQEKAFPDPIIQINRQANQFREWLQLNKLSELPIHGLVVMSNPQTVLRTNDKSLNQIIIRSTSLTQKISELDQLYCNPVLCEKEIKIISRKIIKRTTPLNSSILEVYKLSEKDLVKGIYCENCNHLPLTRIYGYWKCSNCTNKTKDSHLKALNDYSLLLGNMITSSQLRNFLLISSPSLATRLMKSVHANKSGVNKGTVYTLTMDTM
ncbi:nuclease-related domain-containing protein [Rossellomorea aquimaris]|uniref:nuclease-related domain-containing protein n=1 Tax=Rossellomorea aquimaris TaxID=189382 RepID=UPI0007D08123|nr:nuclease-related domain-containing protein [Rossellomorea aquimaris]